MQRLNRLLTLLVVFALVVPIASAAEFFPYEVHKRTLDNGLDVIVIPTPEFKNVINWNTLILAGSRNEIEEGRTGLAHLFEHIAFRHKFEDPENSYDTRIEAIGAFDNAWTWFDVTYYHPVTFASNVVELADVQAERFVDLDFTERIYRTEAGAVLGEYRRNASNPALRMNEVLSDLIYGREHGYGHTTMGYLEDVEDMPNSYKSGKAFYEQYYRPNNAVVIVSGDVDTEQIFKLAEEYYGEWQPRDVPDLPEPPPVEGPKRGHVSWQSDVPPRMTVAWVVPAFEPGSESGAVLSIIGELLSGQTAPLFQELRYEKKVATGFNVGGISAMGFDPRPLEANVRFDKGMFDERGMELIEETEQDIIDGFDDLKNFSDRSDAEETLDALKSKFRYDMLSGLDSAHDIAQTFAIFYRFNRSPNVLDEIVDAVMELEPEDIDEFAAAHFVPSNRVVVTMAYEGAADDVDAETTAE
ncbi:MAG: pitrilysin family protein [Thermoanaerobaculia bacterium]|nr:pitrilysin family protein [Thermoanaerobaculia bacterium]